MRLTSRTSPPLKLTELLGRGNAKNGRWTVEELPAFKMRVSLKAASRTKFGAAGMKVAIISLKNNAEGS